MNKTTTETKPPEISSPKKRLLRIVVPLGVLIVVALIGWSVWHFIGSIVNAHRLEVSGRIEGYETNLGPKIGGRVDWIKYREGNAVKAGELVAKLSDEDYQAQLRGSIARILKAQQAVQQNGDQIILVSAQIFGATKRLAQSKEETSAQIVQAQENLNQSRARYKQAQADEQQARADLELASIRLVRYTNLVRKGAVTKDEYDQASTTYNDNQAIVKSKVENTDASLKAIKSAEASLAQAQAARYTPPIRMSDLQVSQAQLNQAEHQLEQSRHDVDNATADRDQIAANIAYLNIVCPINGVVTARAVEPGAVLVPGQTILTAIDYSQVYMRAFVPEASIGAVRIGQKASVYLDAFPNKPLSGRVIEIDPEASFTPENIYFKDDRVKQVFGIKIGIDHPEGYAKPGMPADARIEL